MKRNLIVALLLIVAVSSVSDAQRRRSGRRKPRHTTSSTATGGMVNVPCATNINSISDCPDQGCGGSFDPNLNQAKNIRTNTQAPADKTLQDLAALPDPVPGYKKGDPRDKLTALGEGQMIRVMAYALVARKGSSETCNCHLTAAKDTDNHIVLVDPSIKKPTLAANEPDSETAEFTPRVRLDHPKLAGVNLQSLIAASPKHALLVRVTGQLMFDSEHSLGRPLKRHNDWEIHPVFGLEYCPKNKTCTADSNANWVSMEQ
jgi:hypothetical protein